MVHQANLFGSSEEPQALRLIDADVNYWPQFIAAGLANQWFDLLLENTDWQQDTITVYGKQHLTPRLSYWVGEQWMDYSYSQHTMQPNPWTPLLKQIKEQIEGLCKVSFNSVLLNYYRDGKDSNGWHSDDEPELGIEPIIASLSLGAARDFHLRHKQTRKVHRMALAPGSLLLMQGSTQTNWQHQIPKRAQAGARINLTFRSIV